MGRAFRGLFAVVAALGVSAPVARAALTVPLVGWSSPASACISVDLPEPDGPMTATSWPRVTSSETPRSASTAVAPSP